MPLPPVMILGSRESPAAYSLSQLKGWMSEARSTSASGSWLAAFEFIGVLYAARSDTVFFAMFIPKPFSEPDLARLDWLAARDAFGTLVSIVGEAPFATQLPVIYRRDGERVVLLGHWSRMNAQHKS